MKKIRVLTVTDLHLRPSLYNELMDAASRHRPDLVACVGDFLDVEPSEGDLTPGIAAGVLSSLACDVVFTRGNHEDVHWPEFENTWNGSGRVLHALHGTAHHFGPLTVVGFPCWLGSDQFYARSRPLERYTPEDWLPDLLEQTGSSGRTLWLMHEPPCMGISSHEAYVPEWLEAIEIHKPAVTVSGHDHTTPLKTGMWHTRIGNTVCINAGQRIYPKPGRLIYCLLDFEFPSGTPSLPTGFKFRRLPMG